MSTPIGAELGWHRGEAAGLHRPAVASADGASGGLSLLALTGGPVRSRGLSSAPTATQFLQPSFEGHSQVVDAGLRFAELSGGITVQGVNFGVTAQLSFIIIFCFANNNNPLMFA